MTNKNKYGIELKLPASLDECAEKLSWLKGLGNRASVFIWMIIFHAKELIGENKAWLQWVQENYPRYQNESQIHHMHNIGELLVDKLDTPIFEKLLAELDFHKLHSLSRLTRNNPDIKNIVEDFCEKHEIATMTREEVRDAVGTELGEAPPARMTTGKKKQGVNPNEQFVQLTFCDYVNTVAAWGEEEVTQWTEDDSVNATNAASAGMRLLKISVSKIEDGEALADQDKEAIISMLEGALKSFKHMEG